MSCGCRETGAPRRTALGCQALSARAVPPYPVVVIGRRAVAAAVAGAAFLLATGCAGPGARPSAAAPGAESPSVTPTPGGLSHRVTPGPAPTRARPLLPRFSATVSGPLALRDVPFSWRPGCPVPPRQLRALHLSSVGFDGTAHIGEIIVSARVARQVIEVFAVL